MTSPPPGSRGTYAKTGQFRADVLDAALKIVAEQGFDAATLQQIALAVGRSKAGLLHHFGSREGLMLDIVRHRDETDRRLFRPDDDGRLAASVDLVSHNATVPGLVALFAVVCALAAADTADTDRRAYFVDRYARTRAGFARRIARAQGEGVMRSDIAAESAATIVLATMDGLQTQWLLDPSIDMAAHLRGLIGMLMPPASAST